MRNIEKNYRPFTAICDCHFGRRIIYTNAGVITKNNIREELSHAMPIHRQNAVEINYLDRYYRGDKPIRYRKKDVRPEVNNRVVINLSYSAVERRVSNILSDPIQYVLRGTDEKKAQEISYLNQVLESENKQELDIRLMRWRSICGTSYRFVENDDQNGDLLDETEFSIYGEDPRLTFVAYFSNDKPAYSCQIRKDEDGNEYYFVYTASEWFKIQGNEIVDGGRNGHFAIPVIEYPNNERRISDIELTMDIEDAINTLSSDRINGVEQFVSAWLVFTNAEIDKNVMDEVRKEGVISLKSNNGAETKADVKLLTNELSQTESQVVFNDLIDRFLDIQGLSSRGLASGGDTGTAVSLRNGHIDSSLRGAIAEPIIKKSENAFIKIILNRLRVTKGFTLLPSDIDIHINHNKMADLLTKAEALKILLESGIFYKRAIKAVDLFSDNEAVASESAERMNILYPTTVQEEQQEQTKTEAIETEKTEQ